MANANVNAPDGTGMRLVCTGMCCMSQLELHFEGSWATCLCHPTWMIFFSLIWSTWWRKRVWVGCTWVAGDLLMWVGLLQMCILGTSLPPSFLLFTAIGMLSIAVWLEADPTRGTNDHCPYQLCAPPRTALHLSSLWGSIPSVSWFSYGNECSMWSRVA